MATAMLNEPLKASYAECVICKTPLGAESKDYGFPFCHTCRKCQRCGSELNYSEARGVLKDYDESLIDRETQSKEPFNSEHCLTEVIHPFCRVLDPNAKEVVKRSELHLLNLLRLAITPVMDKDDKTNEDDAQIHMREYLQWNKMSHDEMFVSCKKLAACASLVKELMIKSPGYRDEIITERRAKLEKADRERAKSINAAPKVNEPKEPSKKALREEAFNNFCAKWKLIDSAESAATFKLFADFVKGSMKAGMPQDVSEALAEAALLKQGRIKNS